MEEIIAYVEHKYNKSRHRNGIYVKLTHGINRSWHGNMLHA